MTVNMNCFCSNLYQLRKPDFRIFSLQLYNFLSKSHPKAQSQSIVTRKMTCLYFNVTRVTTVQVWIFTGTHLPQGWAEDIVQEWLEQYLCSCWCQRAKFLSAKHGFWNDTQLSLNSGSGPCEVSFKLSSVKWGILPPELLFGWLVVFSQHLMKYM